MHLRGRYGHGGRPGYEREWRAEPERSGGGELVDQGMHLLDLSTGWPGRCRCTRRCCAPSSGTPSRTTPRCCSVRRRARSRGRCCTSAGRSGRTCSRSRSTARGEAPGRRPRPLLRPQRSADLPHGPGARTAALEEVTIPTEDRPGRRMGALRRGDGCGGDGLLGDLDSARDAWEQVEAAYAAERALHRDALDGGAEVVVASCTPVSAVAGSADRGDGPVAPRARHRRRPRRRR